MEFSAHVITGSARGRKLGVPTLNLETNDVPADLQDGIYACFAVIDGKSYPGAMHNGPRPTFNDTRSCEVHLIDHVLPTAPETVTVNVVERIRDVKAFPTAEALVAEMERDIAAARAILAA
jgi:riboflavin kinase/FMN adenylyltransferase